MATWWMNGQLQPLGTPMVTANDHGLTVGDGVFETIEIAAGQPFAARRHLERLRASARGLGLAIPASDEELRAAMADTIRASGLTAGRIRLTVTAGPRSARLGSGRR